MSIQAAGYVLNVPPDRRELLLEEAEHGGSYYSSDPFVAEPVPAFHHSRRAPLVVFASFEGRGGHAYCRWKERHLGWNQTRAAQHAGLEAARPSDRIRRTSK